MFFKVRISKSYEEAKKFLEVFDKYIVYQHDISGNVHIHLLLEYDKKEDSLRNIFKKTYNKTEYSVGTTYGKKPNLKPVNEAFVSYMSKGQFDPLFNNLLTQERVTELKALGFDKGTDIVPVPSTRKNRATRRELVDIIHTKVLQQKELADDKHLFLEDILQIIRDVIVANNDVLGYYKIMELYDGYNLYYDPKTLIRELATRIISRTRV